MQLYVTACFCIAVGTFFVMSQDCLFMAVGTLSVTLQFQRQMLHCNLGHKISNYDGILKNVQNQHEELDSCIQDLEGGQECLEMVAHILNKKVIMSLV